MIFLTKISPAKNTFKHYLIETNENLVNVRWGRKGLSQSKLHELESKDAATEWIRKQLRQKLLKGYNLGNYSQLTLF